jgi:hypothetical protein
MPLKGTPAQRKKQVFAEFKAGNLHSGKGGPVVKNPKQAVAIALSQTRKTDGPRKR